MEVFGVFLLAQLFFPVPWIFHLLLCVYNGVGGAVDHCGFYVPNSMFDGRYHFVHHTKITYNYAEMEILDRWMGTYASMEDCNEKIKSS